jgi:hypothetical protein
MDPQRLLQPVFIPILPPSKVYASVERRLARDVTDRS